MILGARAIMPIELAQSIASFSRSVAKIEFDGFGWGTGFLVSKDLVLTASHVLGPKAELSKRKFTLNFDYVRSSNSESFIDTVPYPWADPAASELHGILANAYPDDSSRIQILAIAGIERKHLLSEGTPHRTWTQALEFASSSGKIRRVVEAVLADDGVAGYHGKISSLLVSDSQVMATPVEMDMPNIVIPTGHVTSVTGYSGCYDATVKNASL